MKEITFDDFEEMVPELSERGLDNVHGKDLLELSMLVATGGPKTALNTRGAVAVREANRRGMKVEVPEDVAQCECGGKFCFAWALRHQEVVEPEQKEG